MHHVRAALMRYNPPRIGTPRTVHIGASDDCLGVWATHHLHMAPCGFHLDTFLGFLRRAPCFKWEFFDSSAKRSRGHGTVPGIRWKWVVKGSERGIEPLKW